MKPQALVPFVVLALALVPAAAAAHVYITNPSDGAEVEVGSAVDIRWDIAVNHGPPDTYDLMFSMDGGDTYQVLANGLPGSPASYSWVAPDGTVADARLSILQHGSGGYEFMHSVDFTVGAPPGADVGVAAAPDVGLISRPDNVVEPIDNTGAQAPTTAEGVLAMLDRRCAVSGCHAATTPQAGLNLTIGAFPDNLVGAASTTAADAKLVPADCTTTGELLARVRGERALNMPPPPEEPLSAEDVAALETWIGAGAPAQGSLNEAKCPASAEDGGGCSTTPTPGGGLVLVVLLGVALRRRRQGGGW